MDALTSDELRLAYALLPWAAALAGAWKFVARRRDAADRLDVATDALLLTFLIQYVSVCVPGMLRVLSPLSIGATTLALSALLYFAPARHRPPLTKPRDSSRGPEVVQQPPTQETTTRLDRWLPRTCALFALGYVACLAYQYRLAPVLANDALTYHFPAAVHWLQQGRLALFETWYFNPANTYSPLAGSAFIAWWVAPLGNDVLARHVQIPALALIFLAALRLGRALGLRPALAAVVALALVLSRPFLRQSIIEKDDLFLAAFATCAAAAFAPTRLRDPLGPWRVGVALGLMLATKYTALLCLPALLLLADAPKRADWRWRHYAVAAACVLAIAGPWYLRNLILTGNPLYPLNVLGLPHLFATARSDAFTGPPAAWATLTAPGQGLPAAPLIAVTLAAIAAIGLKFRALRSDPILRYALLGPAVLVALFFLTSPYPEARFVYPAFVLLFVAAGVAVAAVVKKPTAQVVAALALILGPAWLTAFGFAFDADGGGEIVAALVGAGAVATAAGLAIRALASRAPAAGRYAALAGAALLAMWAYVSWGAFLNECRAYAFELYKGPYAATAEAWQWVDANLPLAEPLAYANAFLVHPLTGFDHRRPLVHVPTRRGVARLSDLPPLPGRLSGERLNPAVAAAQTADPDAGEWLKRLTAGDATHLIVFRGGAGVTANPPELSIIGQRPIRFTRVFGNDAAVVYRVAR